MKTIPIRRSHDEHLAASSSDIPDGQKVIHARRCTVRPRIRPELFQLVEACLSGTVTPAALLADVSKQLKVLPLRGHEH